MGPIGDSPGRKMLPSPHLFQEGEARYRTLIETSADGVLVVGLDGTIAFANPAACGLLGWEARRLVGRAFGVPIVPGETTEVDIHRADGAVRVAEMRTAETRWQGAPAYLAALRDVTERKQAEDAVREASETLRSFYDSAAMMMGVVELIDDDLRVISSNAATARFLGARAGDLDGQRVRRLGVPPAALDCWIAQNREAEQTGAPVRFEYIHDSATGPIWLSATVGFIRQSPEGRSQFSFVIEDVTARKQAEQALKEADRRKDEFLAMLAHELRNPLAAIDCAIQLFRRPDTEGDHEWGREVIERQSKHLARLIEDLLDISRISRGKIQLRKEPLDLATTLRRSIEAARPLIEGRKHTLSVSIASAPMWLDADPTRLEQIVVNLLTNAAKYTEEGGRIWLSAEPDGEELVIRVRDTGIGIPAEMLPRVFELFTQVERTLERAQGGLGIGLALVQKLAAMHGGRVSASSAGRNRGSEFTVRLPSSPRAMPTRPGPGVPAAPARTGGKRILIVDDNVDSTRGMARLLRASGHEVETAHEGRSALTLADSFRPEVVLLDIGLPGMNGYQVAEALRRGDRGRTVRLIAVSGYGQEQDIRRSHEAGFDLHLVKPVDYNLLLALLDRPDPGSDPGSC